MDDESCESVEPRFRIWDQDLGDLQQVAEFVQRNMSWMSGDEKRSAATLLRVLGRLPAVTEHVLLTFSFTQPNLDGNYGWASIEVSEYEIALTAGEHFYDEEVGGDTELRTLYSASETRSEGEVRYWLSLARAIAEDRRLSIQDECDYGEDAAEPASAR